MTIRIAVVGGKLQGTEAVYLAQKAGFKILLIDKNPSTPAVGLCDGFMAHAVIKAARIDDYEFEVDDFPGRTVPRQMVKEPIQH